MQNLYERRILLSIFCEIAYKQIKLENIHSFATR